MQFRFRIQVRTHYCFVRNANTLQSEVADLLTGRSRLDKQIEAKEIVITVEPVEEAQREFADTENEWLPFRRPHWPLQIKRARTPRISVAGLGWARCRR